MCKCYVCEKVALFICTKHSRGWICEWAEIELFRNQDRIENLGYTIFF